MPTIATLTITVKDNKGKQGRCRFYTDVDDATFGSIGDKLIDLYNYLSEIARRVDKVIKGVVVNVSITIDGFIFADMKTMATLDSDVEEGGRLTFPGSTFRTVIPSFDHNIFGVGETDINTFPEAGLDADLAALVTLLVQSTDAPDWPNEYGIVTDNRGDRLTAYPFVKKVFKES